MTEYMTRKKRKASSKNNSKYFFIENFKPALKRVHFSGNNGKFLFTVSYVSVVG